MNMRPITDAPAELAASITEFWLPDEWNNAASIAWLESGWSAFAVADTRTPDAPCGAPLPPVDGIPVTAEWSIGWFQINACNLPSGWNPAHLFNTRHNAGTAHDIWSKRGWAPWYFSAKKLGLIN